MVKVVNEIEKRAKVRNRLKDKPLNIPIGRDTDGELVHNKLDYVVAMDYKELEHLCSLLWHGVRNSDFEGIEQRSDGGQLVCVWTKEDYKPLIAQLELWDMYGEISEIVR